MLQKTFIRLCDLWINAYEPETKQQCTMWVFEDEPYPTKVVRGRRTSKQMVACFFCKTGHVASVEHYRTFNSECYSTICLHKVLGVIRKTNKRKRIIVRHDNTSSHTSAQTSAFLTGQNVELMAHPPYSSDLAPINFCYSRTSGKKCVVNDFQRLKKLLKMNISYSFPLTSEFFQV